MVFAEKLKAVTSKSARVWIEGVLDDSSMVEAGEKPHALVAFCGHDFPVAVFVPAYNGTWWNACLWEGITYDEWVSILEDTAAEIYGDMRYCAC